MVTYTLKKIRKKLKRKYSTIRDQKGEEVRKYFASCRRCDRPLANVRCIRLLRHTSGWSASDPASKCMLCKTFPHSPTNRGMSRVKVNDKGMTCKQRCTMCATCAVVLASNLLQHALAIVLAMAVW